MAIKGARLGFNDKRAGKGNVPLLVRAGERVTIRCASSLLTSESVCQLAVIIMSGCEGVCVSVCVRTFVPTGQPMCVYIYLTFFLWYGHPCPECKDKLVPCEDILQRLFTTASCLQMIRKYRNYLKVNRSSERRSCIYND